MMTEYIWHRHFKSQGVPKMTELSIQRGIDLFENGSYLKAYDLFKPLSDLGFIDAQYYCALIRRRDFELLKDLDLSFELLIKSAQNGHILAAQELALMFHPRSVDTNATELRNTYNSGRRRIESDQLKCIEFFLLFRKNALQLANSGNSWGEYYLGWWYQNGFLDADRSYESAIKHYTRSAEMGNPSGSSNLANVYGELGEKAKADESYRQFEIQVSTARPMHLVHFPCVTPSESQQIQ